MSNGGLCVYCMEQTDANGYCAACGDGRSVVVLPHHLPPGTRLKERYTIGKALGEGGFGITYIGFDSRTNVKVAVKEYYPGGFVTRNYKDGRSVQSRGGDKGQVFDAGRDRFINEAARLAKFFGLPGIVEVNDFFTENGTAYIVMEFVQGATLRSVLENMGGRMNEAHVLEIMKPLISSLAQIHLQGVLHRDIAPDNIMIRPDGSIKLLDFGAAREVDANAQSTMAILKHGYTPEEQYGTNRSRQGPWTDVYALCATIYRAIEGKVPPDAMSRLQNDELRGFTLPVSKSTAAAVSKGLAVSPKNRFQSMSDLEAALYPTQSVVTPRPEKNISRGQQNMGKYNGNTEFVVKGTAAKISLADVFSDMFKKHSVTDMERLFMSGLSTTTPSERNMLKEWKKPWLFVWVLAACAVVFAISLWLTFSFDPTAGFALIAFVGTAMVPITFVIFAFELNVPRNVPLYSVLLMFFIGGLCSLVITVFILQYVNDSGQVIINALREEGAKLVIVSAFLAFPRKNRYSYILNGVLIGAAVGNGFSAFESAKYFFDYGGDLDVLFMRALLSPGGHGLWAAIYGGALAWVKGREPLSVRCFFDLRFLTYLSAPVILHSLWNWQDLPYIPLGYVDLSRVILTLAGWLVLLRLINAGVRQAATLSGSYRDADPSIAYALFCVSGAFANTAFPLVDGALVLGRDPRSCNILFPAATAGVSRKHCVIALQGADVTITDAGSSQGTIMGGTRLQPGVPVPLKEGQRFTLASGAAVFELRASS